MPLVIFFLVLIVIVWTIALMRLNISLAGVKKLSLLHGLAMLIVLTGSVLGYEFFHASGGPIPLTIDRILFLGLLALAGWGWLTNREHLRMINRMDIAMIGVTAILVISTITHDFKYDDNLPLSRLLFFYMMPMGVYAVVRTAKLGKHDLAMYSIALACFAVYLALTGVAEMKYLHAIVFPKYIADPDFTEFFGRGRGPFLNPVSNGFFQITGLCCMWFWWPKVGTRVRALIAVGSLIIVAGIYATLTRSVWLSLIVVGGTAIWFSAPQSKKGGLLIAATLGGILLFPVLGDKLLSFKRDKEVTVSQMTESAQLRPLFFTVAMRMFQDRPLLGCGFGQYAREKYPYLQDPFTGKPLSKTKSYLQHNVFLAYLTELGIIGLTTLIALLAVMGRAAYRLWFDRKQDLLRRQFGLLLAAILTTFCINGMFHDTSIMPMVNMLLFFAAGAVNNIQTTRASMPELVTTTPIRQSQRHGYPVAN